MPSRDSIREASGVRRPAQHQAESQPPNAASFYAIAEGESVAPSLTVVS
ncbi:hypothetical protein LCGC14_3029010, partial [marine sediment metagenome]